MTLTVKKIKNLWRQGLFSRWSLFIFVNAMETRPNMTKATLTEVCPRHSRLKICKITEKIGLKLYKLIFFLGNNQII